MDRSTEQPKVPQGRRTQTLGKRQAAKWAETDYIVLDTETTGLGADARILEVAVIDRSGSVLLDTMVNPGMTPITPEAQEVHGITREMVRNTPSFFQVWTQQLRDIILNHDIIMAYNADFDIRMIEQSLNRNQQALLELRSAAAGCVMMAYAQYRKDRNPGETRARYSLNHAMQDFQIPREGTEHRALSDALAARKVLETTGQEQRAL